MAESNLRVVIEAVDQASATLRNVEKNLSTMGDNLTRIGGRLSIGITAPLVAIGTVSLKAAMDAQRTENLFNASMGSMADQARAFSETLRSQFGLNAQEMRQQIAVLFQLSTNLGISEAAALEMSTGLTRVAQSLAVAFGISSQEAMNKLQGGIAGMGRGLKELGIIVDDAQLKMVGIRQNLIKEGQELSEAQKAWLRYQAILEQTQRVQSDLAQNMATPAGRLTALKTKVNELAESLGNVLIPAFLNVIKALQPLLGFLEKAVQAFARLPSGVQTAVVSFGLFMAALGPLMFAIGIAIKTLAGLSAAITALTWGIAALTNPITAMIAIMAALGIAAFAMSQRHRQAHTSMQQDWATTLDMAKRAALEEEATRLQILISKQSLKLIREPVALKELTILQEFEKRLAAIKDELEAISKQSLLPFPGFPPRTLPALPSFPGLPAPTLFGAENTADKIRDLASELERLGKNDALRRQVQFLAEISGMAETLLPLLDSMGLSLEETKAVLLDIGQVRLQEPALQFELMRIKNEAFIDSLAKTRQGGEQLLRAMLALEGPVSFTFEQMKKRLEELPPIVELVKVDIEALARTLAAVAQQDALRRQVQYLADIQGNAQNVLAQFELWGLSLEQQKDILLGINEATQTLTKSAFDLFQAFEASRISAHQLLLELAGIDADLAGRLVRSAPWPIGLPPLTEENIAKILGPSPPPGAREDLLEFFRGIGIPTPPKRTEETIAKILGPSPSRRDQIQDILEVLRSLNIPAPPRQAGDSTPLSIRSESEKTINITLVLDGKILAQVHGTRAENEEQVRSS